MKRFSIATLVIVLGHAPLAQLGSQSVVPHRWIAELGIAGVNNVSPSPNGRFLVIDSSGTLRIYERSTRAQWSLGVSGSEVVWSAKGERIAFQSSEAGQPAQIWTMPMNAATGKPAGPAQRVTAKSGVMPAFSPDGRTVAYQREGNIYATAATGGEERLLVDEARPVGRVQYSPDGNWLYFVVTEAMNGPTIHRKPVNGGSATSLGLRGHLLGLSADGKNLAYYPILPYVADDAAIKFATADGTEFARLRLPQHTYWGRWSGNGKFLFANLDIPASLNRVTLSNGQLQQISPPTSHDRLPALSPDGKLLAVQRQTGSDEFRIALLQPNGQVVRTLPASVPLLDVPHQWSPDGRSIAAINLKRQLVVYDVASGRERLMETGTVSSRNFAWRSNSAAVAFVLVIGFSHWEVREAALDGRRTLLRTFEPREVAAQDGGRALRIQFLDDQRLLMVRENSISVVANAGGQERVIFSERPSIGVIAPVGVETGPLGISVSPDAKSIAFAYETTGGAETVAVVPVAGGEKKLLNVSHRCGLGVGRWHPDGRSVFIGTFNCDTNRGDFQLVPLDGGSARPLTTVDKDAVDIGGLTVAPDGSYIIYDSERAWRSRIGEIDVTALAAKSPPRK